MQTPLTLRRWSRVEYERLVESGVFDRDPVELIGGQLIVAEPQGTYHVTTIGIVDDALRAALPARWIVRTQAPIALDDESAPAPDLAVVPGSREDYLNGHPSVPALVIEVADTSVDFDRRVKGGVYARGGVQDYWIVNLTDRILEIYRDPHPDGAAPWGFAYRSVQRLRPADVATPLALPSVAITVATLLPRRAR